MAGEVSQYVVLSVLLLNGDANRTIGLPDRGSCRVLLPQIGVVRAGETLTSPAVAGLSIGPRRAPGSNAAIASWINALTL